MHKNRKTKIGFIICISVLMLIELASLFLMYKSSNNISLAEVKLTENDFDQSFAVLIEQDDGSYIEQEPIVKTWPSSDKYNYNSGKSGCIDANGTVILNVLSYDSATGVATVDTTNTSYCYLYFDLK